MRCYLSIASYSGYSCNESIVAVDEGTACVPLTWLPDSLSVPVDSSAVDDTDNVPLEYFII